MPFDGKTYDRKIDKKRLLTQFEQVKKIMLSGCWRTLKQLTTETGGTESSVSARLRDLRKDKFGGYEVERRRVVGGLFEYRLKIPVAQQSEIFGRIKWTEYR